MGHFIEVQNIWHVTHTGWWTMSPNLTCDSVTFFYLDCYHYVFSTSPKRNSGWISNINITGYMTRLFENLNREKLALLVATRLPVNSAIDTDTHPLVFYRKQKKLQHWVKFCFLGPPTLHNQIIWPKQGEEGLVPLFSPLVEQQQKLKTKKATASVTLKEYAEYVCVFLTGVHPCSCNSPNLPASDIKITKTDGRALCQTCLPKLVGRGWIGITCFYNIHVRLTRPANYKRSE